MRPGQNGGKKRFKTANKSEFTAGHRASFVADSVLTVRGSPHFALVSIQCPITPAATGQPWLGPSGTFKLLLVVGVTSGITTW